MSGSEACFQQSQAAHFPANRGGQKPPAGGSGRIRGQRVAAGARTLCQWRKYHHQIQTNVSIKLVLCLQTYNNREKSLSFSCSLLLTSEHILTVREAFPFTINSLLPACGRHDPIKGAQALSCAAISDLTSFRLPSAEQSWCILVRRIKLIVKHIKHFRFCCRNSRVGKCMNTVAIGFCISPRMRNWRASYRLWRCCGLTIMKR